MEIEVGEYIRTESGIIAKVLSELYEYKDGYKRDYDNDILNDWYNDEVIVKHSKNIIDLIEVGDIVEYIDDDGEYIKDFIIKKHTPVSLISLIEYLKAYCKVISILTHEQYEQNSYKIGE